MALILDGTNGLSDVDGTAATPAIRGSDANTGVFFGTDIVGVSTGGTERVRVNSAGYVTYANNPAFSASLSGSNQSVTDGSTVTLTYGTVNHNRGSAYNNSTFTFTAPITGMYQFNARARVDGIAGGGVNYAILAIITTGQSYFNICSASGSFNNIQISVSAYMLSGHTAYVTLNSSGQTLNSVNSQPIYSDFSGFFIG